MGPPAGQKPVPVRRNPFIRPGQSRSASPGRIVKPTDTPKRTWSPSVFLNCTVNTPDPTKLHVNYVPRSPIQTRAKTAQEGSQQKVNTPGEPSGSKSSASNSAVLTSNIYDVLSDEDNGDDDDENNPRNGQGNAVKEDDAKTKNKKQVPIVVPDYPGAALSNLLSRAGCEFEMLILKNSIRISTLSDPMYQKVRTVLQNNNVPYYSYDSRDKAPVKIVLTGYVSVTPTQLAEVLADYNVNPQEIRAISSIETITGTHVLYLLIFDRGSVKIQDLRQIKTLDGFVVSWRYFTKRPTDAAQCHRCQRFGHGSRNCTLAPKCVKCGEAHLTDKCSLPRKSSLEENNNAEQTKARVKCANCKGNHTANFRGCSARKAYLEVLEKQRKKPANRLTPRTTITTTHQPAEQRPTIPPGWGRSYANVAASASGPTPTPATAPDGTDLFTLSEFLGLAREMFTRFRACQNKEQQFMALGELMMKYVGPK